GVVDDLRLLRQAHSSPPSSPVGDANHNRPICHHDVQGSLMAEATARFFGHTRSLPSMLPCHCDTIACAPVLRPVESKRTNRAGVMVWSPGMFRLRSPAARSARVGWGDRASAFS